MSRRHAPNGRPRRRNLGGRARPAAEKAIPMASRAALNEAARGLGAWIPPEVVRGATSGDRVVPGNYPASLHRPTLDAWRLAALLYLCPPVRDEWYLEAGQVRRDVRRMVNEWRNGKNFLVANGGQYGIADDEDD